MAHYAITELFIVLAALYGARQLLAHELHFAALGFLIFGAAASIGVIRFPSGQIEQLAGLHRLAGTLGGLIAMQALTHQNAQRYKVGVRPPHHCWVSHWHMPVFTRVSRCIFFTMVACLYLAHRFPHPTDST